MINAYDLYPSYAERDGYFYGPCSYQPIIDAMGNILIQVDDEDYQGDTRALVQHEGKYGWVQFGWGSCSYCDSLQACDNMQDIQDVIDSIVSGTKWFDSAEECLEFFKNHDWEGDYSWYQAEQRDFVEQVIEYLQN